MGHSGSTTPPGWYPDPAGTPGKAYWDGYRWAPPAPKPPANRNTLIIGSIAGLVLLLVLLSNCGGDDKRSGSSTTSTVTRTITVTAAPSTTTVTVSAVAEPPPPELPVLTVPPVAPPTEQPPAEPVPLMPQVPQAPTNVYYPNCAAARAAGAAPLHVGEPGYRSGLDRDNDGVACE